MDKRVSRDDARIASDRSAGGPALVSADQAGDSAAASVRP
jgi:hypothetical protein